MSLIAAGAAQCHAMPNSMVLVELGGHDVGVEVILPWAELKYALPAALAQPPRVLGAQARTVLSAYARDHLGAETADHRAFAVTLRDLELVHSADHADLRLRYRLTPPAGAEPAPFVLRVDAVTHVVMSHVAFVFVRQGKAEPQLVGALQNPRTSFMIEPPRSSGFLAAFRLGAAHIATGFDHLVFLLTLLLPAPLISEGGRWTGRRPVWGTVRALTTIVTGFTIGHSLTLLLGATFDLGLPQQPVEVAIGVSILIAAISAWRPFVFEGWAGPVVAVGFGLVHGLAFSSAIREHLAGAQGRLATILGFNLGIEAVQLLVVLLVAPILVALARTPAYDRIRIGAAAGSGLAALAWIGLRLTNS
ncbi:MAG: HupE/UreJ family protein [Caulobacteraceae bacterium]